VEEETRRKNKEQKEEKEALTSKLSHFTTLQEIYNNIFYSEL
jgi:hypothetical protein